MLVDITGLLAAHVAFLLCRISGAIALLQAVLHTHRLCADLQRPTQPCQQEDERMKQKRNVLRMREEIYKSRNQQLNETK